MVIVLPTVTSSLVDAPCAASIAPPHRRGMEIGPGGHAKAPHTCPCLLWTHMDTGISAHTGNECVTANTWGCLQLTGLRMIFLRVTVWSIQKRGDLLGGPPLFSLLDAFHLLPCPPISSLEAAPHTRSQSRLQSFLLLLHYHMNGCHIAACCMDTVGTQSPWLGERELTIAKKSPLCISQKRRHVRQKRKGFLIDLQFWTSWLQNEHCHNIKITFRYSGKLCCVHTGDNKYKNSMNAAAAQNMCQQKSHLQVEYCILQHKILYFVQP